MIPAIIVASLVAFGVGFILGRESMRSYKEAFEYFIER